MNRKSFIASLFGWALAPFLPKQKFKPVNHQYKFGSWMRIEGDDQFLFSMDDNEFGFRIIHLKLKPGTFETMKQHLFYGTKDEVESWLNKNHGRSLYA